MKINNNILAIYSFNYKKKDYIWFVLLESNLEIQGAILFTFIDIVDISKKGNYMIEINSK